MGSALIAAAGFGITAKLLKIAIGDLMEGWAHLGGGVGKQQQQEAAEEDQKMGEMNFNIIHRSFLFGVGSVDICMIAQPDSRKISVFAESKKGEI